jgi:hypothetical protein
VTGDSGAAGHRFASVSTRAPHRRRTVLAIAGVLGGATAGMAGMAVLALLLGIGAMSPSCDTGSPDATAVLPAGGGATVGATEYGGPGDPSSGTTGARGDDLLLHPDSYAELGGTTWQTATAMGGLPYLTPLRITWGRRSAIAYKRDFGLGGGPVGGRPRSIDLWWQLAGHLGIPYEDGQWSGAVQISRPPAGGSGTLLDQGVAGQLAGGGSPQPGPAPGCGDPAGGGVALTAGPRATILAGGRAAAPASAPPAVRQIIAAGNQIVGRPYVYGAAHGLPLSEVAGAYDCSSSVEHLLYGARLLPLMYGAPSGDLERFGAPGPGRWVTIYASADHVFMYVAGLRWDTHDAAGPGDGSAGIGWHPLVRGAAGFVVRHPVGL